ncbi:MAG: glycosyltransferase family 2 protein [Bdellovibrionota bacterium]
MDISIICPVFNERGNLIPLLDELEAVMKAFGRSYEIIAVDDGSTDGSGLMLAEQAKKRQNLIVLSLRGNCGQAAAFDAGFREAKGEIVVTMDSDRQNDPNDIPRLVAEIEKGFDFVTGWRKNRQDGFWLRTMPSKIANSIIRTVTKTKVHDLGCSLKAYRAEISSELRLYGEMHRFISVLVEGTGARVSEVVVNHRARVEGESKYGLSRTFKVLLDLLTVWFMRGFQTKPIYIFGGMGCGLLMLSFMGTCLTAYDKIADGVYVHRNPVFLISVVFAVIGVQFLGMGLIAELIIRTYFESQNKKAYSIARRIDGRQQGK